MLHLRRASKQRALRLRGVGSRGMGHGAALVVGGTLRGCGLLVGPGGGHARVERGGAGRGAGGLAGEVVGEPVADAGAVEEDIAAAWGAALLLGLRGDAGHGGGGARQGRRQGGGDRRGWWAMGGVNRGGLGGGKLNRWCCRSGGGCEVWGLRQRGQADWRREGGYGCWRCQAGRCLALRRACWCSPFGRLDV